MGEDAQAEFYSVAVTNHHQQADTGTKMIHLAPGTRSTIISKGISAGQSQNAYRGLVKVGRRACGARNYSSCDSLLLSSTSGAHTFPYIDVQNDEAWWSMRLLPPRFQKSSCFIAHNAALRPKMQ